MVQDLKKLIENELRKWSVTGLNNPVVEKNIQVFVAAVIKIE